MTMRGAPLFRLIGAGIVGLVLVGISAAAVPLVKKWWQASPGESHVVREAEDANKPRLHDPSTVALPPDVVTALGIQTAPAKRATQARPLPALAGSLALNAQRLARVHARFGGEVIDIGPGPELDPRFASGGATGYRPLRYGDKVQKDQLLAVVWSKDLGEKKSELVDAVSRLRTDQETLARLSELYKAGATPERSVREAERNVEADLVAVARAERTLRSWRLTDAEIEAIKAEANHIRRGLTQRDTEWEKAWARVEVRASQDGTILEKNVTVGDIVDTTTDLFKIADLSRLSVWAHAYEETLPVLEALPKPITWSIRLKAHPEAAPLKGTVESIGAIIDANQHTALVMGQVDNCGGELRAGQFITATIEVPPSADEVEVPTTAVVEDGRASLVFVQADPTEPRYSARRVAVVRRYHDVVYVRSRPTSEEARRRVQSLSPGELVVSSGAVELKGALEDLQTTAGADK
jgi:cobalt-zinc-cadmium efflux system membrane fusion protein